MKRRVRTQPTNPYYSNEPAVARSKIADQGLVQNASLGNQPPKMVDKKPGKLSGVAGFSDHKRPRERGPQNPSGVSPLKSGAAKPSSVPKQGGGHLRMSGNPGAHRLGSLKPLKLKV